MPPADVTDFERIELCGHNSKSGRIVYLCESEASATNVFCAKAKRQQQLRVGEIDLLQII